MIKNKCIAAALLIVWPGLLLRPAYPQMAVLIGQNKPAATAGTFGVVQGCANGDPVPGDSQLSISCTMPANLTPGNDLIVCGGYSEATTFTPQNGGTSTLIFDKSWDFDSNCYIEVGITGGTKVVTIDYDVSTRFSIINAVEIVGAFSGGSPIDQLDDSVFTSGNTTMVTNSVTTIQSGEIIVGFFCGADVSLTFTAVSPYTMQALDHSNQPVCGLETQIQATAGSVSASMTTSPTSDYIPVIFTIKHN